MNLLNLAPNIQEAIQFLPRLERGKDPITERELRPIVAEVEWGRQREVWAVVLGKVGMLSRAGFMRLWHFD